MAAYGNGSLVDGSGLGLGLYRPGTTLSPEVGPAIGSNCRTPAISFFFSGFCFRHVTGIADTNQFATLWLLVLRCTAVCKHGLVLVNIFFVMSWYPHVGVSFFFQCTYGWMDGWMSSGPGLSRASSTRYYKAPIVAEPLSVKIEMY